VAGVGGGAAGAHRVGLTRAGLAVREDGRIVASRVGGEGGGVPLRVASMRGFAVASKTSACDAACGRMRSKA
jgi:hypothetical protein